MLLTVEANGRKSTGSQHFSPTPTLPSRTTNMVRHLGSLVHGSSPPTKRQTRSRRVMDTESLDPDKQPLLPKSKRSLQTITEDNGAGPALKASAVKRKRQRFYMDDGKLKKKKPQPAKMTAPPAAGLWQTRNKAPYVYRNDLSISKNLAAKIPKEDGTKRRKRSTPSRAASATSKSPKRRCQSQSRHHEGKSDVTRSLLGSLRGVCVLPHSARPSRCTVTL
ncbi:hypothetical protein HPB50_001075 [Hyalomma asiaticum]|uniref:Uncharacterized protein n=1 Tax=Hyalomma asiaticum TaxID=266040 RepID=A0ACB7RP33_HYAAI|nr:hypothetical protein HPB50_001075 [Hyalomma asiaticum]